MVVLFGELRLLLNNPTLKLGRNVIARNTSFSEYNYLSNNVLITNSKLGKFSYLGENTRVSNTTIGSFTCIGPDVKIGLGRHPVQDFVSIHPAFYSTAKQVGKTFVTADIFNEKPPKTIIGNDVWIGVNVVIAGGIKIGNGAIIAGGSVVTKDVESYSIVAGIPAKVIKYRFDDHQIDKLLKTNWWDNSTESLNLNANKFRNIKSFMDLQNDL